MADFGLDKVFSLNLQVVISQEPLGFRSEHFQSSHISMILTNGPKLEKFWEIIMSSWMIWYGIAWAYFKDKIFNLGMNNLHLVEVTMGRLIFGLTTVTYRSYRFFWFYFRNNWSHGTFLLRFIQQWSKR